MSLIRAVSIPRWRWSSDSSTGARLRRSYRMWFCVPAENVLGGNVKLSVCCIASTSCPVGSDPPDCQPKPVLCAASYRSVVEHP